MDVWNASCGELVGAVRHHRYFTEDEEALARLVGFCQRIELKGVKAFVDEEYPPGSSKAMIVNEVAGRLCLVDGNAHMVALVACRPDLTLAELVECAGRTDFVRVWKDGWEEGSGQSVPYEVYIPRNADASSIPRCRDGVDGFKDPPQPTKVILATVAFDTPLLPACDRGRPVGETARFVREAMGEG